MARWLDEITDRLEKYSDYQSQRDSDSRGGPSFSTS